VTRQLDDMPVPPDEFSRRDIEFHRATAAAYDEEVTATYGVYHRYLLEPYLDRLAIELGPGRCLDLGCGTGVITLALVRRGFDVLGIDHSEQMLAIAKAKLAAAGGPGTYRLVVGDVRDLPASDGEFDCVTCQGLLHHLSEMEPCLVELDRVLRPGGFFYISEPCLGATPLKRALTAVWGLRRLGRDRVVPDGQESVELPISAAELKKLLDSLGLRFEMRFITHLAPLRSVLPENLYVLAVRAVSFPWRRRRGDLLFVFGQKPSPSASSAVSSG
jgi:2-polyprenyl-3-methyl-5-hydroxy-6-metoxy-1,4-benzoquinol methylase